MYIGQWFLMAFLAVSCLGQLVVVALSVPDSLVQAFFAVASVSLYSLRSWRFSDDHSCVYLVIRLLVVLASLAEISHDLDSLSSAVGCGHMPLLSLFLTLSLPPQLSPLSVSL